MSYHDTFLKTFTAANAIVQGARVKVTAASTVDTTDATVNAIGVAERAAAQGELVTVRMWAPTYRAVAAGAISVGALVGPAAAGKVDDAATPKTAVALELAGADGDLIEIAVVEATNA